MKYLDGAELAGYIQERQAKQVRALRQSWRVNPKLVIVRSSDDPVIATYVRLKSAYGSDIGIEVVDMLVQPGEEVSAVERANVDTDVHGIIVQLPLADSALTDGVLACVAQEKDVDGLGIEPIFTPATAMAIDWLLAGYNIELEGKEIAVVGQGRLVGAPLTALWSRQGLDVHAYDDKTTDVAVRLQSADVIVTATGVPGLVTSDMVKHGAVIVDAGTASENGRIVGDVADEVRERDDITITPVRGGVGPLTIAALFDNVLRAARVVADTKGQQDL